MPTTPTGWVPDSVLSGIVSGASSLPDWIPQEWRQLITPEQLAQATAYVDSTIAGDGQLQQGRRGAIGGGIPATDEQRRYAILLNLAQTVPGIEIGDQDTSRLLTNALAGGAGVVSAFPGLFGAGTGAATTYPYVAGGPVIVSPLAGGAVGASAAGGAGAAIAPAAGAAATGLNWTTLVPSIVSGVTGILGANAQADASGDALALSERMFNQAREDALPRIQTGNRAVGVLDQVQGLTTGIPDMSRFFTSPDYQFNLQQGTQAGERALAAMGLRQSGPAVKEATRFASGLASREYGSFIDRLLATAGLGTTGAAQSAAAGATNASLGGAALQNQGAARSSGYGAVNDAVQGGIGNYLLQQYLRRNPVPG